MANHKSVDERLAAAKEKSERAAAEVKRLAMQQRLVQARLRQRGEKVALDLLLTGLAADTALAASLWALADKAQLPPDKRTALALVLGTQPEGPSKSKAA